MNFKDVCPHCHDFRAVQRGGVSHRKEEFTSRGGLPTAAGGLLGLLLETAGFEIRLTDKGDCYGKIRRIFKFKRKGEPVSR